MSRFTIYSVFALLCFGLAIDSSPVPQSCNKGQAAGAATDAIGKLTALPLKNPDILPLKGSAALNAQLNTNLSGKNPGSVAVMGGLNGHIGTILTPKNTGIVPPNLKPLQQSDPIKESAGHNGNDDKDNRDDKKGGREKIKELSSNKGNKFGNTN